MVMAMVMKRKKTKQGQRRRKGQRQRKGPAPWTAGRDWTISIHSTAQSECAFVAWKHEEQRRLKEKKEKVTRKGQGIETARTRKTRTPAVLKSEGSTIHELWTSKTKHSMKQTLVRDLDLELDRVR